MIESDSDEVYVIERAKEFLKINALVAKAWMVTAKTLYPNNFEVQWEAYILEKSAGHVKEAARCFSNLISKFQNEGKLWTEIELVTNALRTENTADVENQFLCEMFAHISTEVQHKLLLFTADHCEDTMEHCKLLLLLLQRFPTAISSYGARLVDTLLSAEKHSVDGNHPVNEYRKLLVCELLPLLNSDKVKIELPSKLLFKLLHKSIDFFVSYISLPSGGNSESEARIENPWFKLFNLIEFIGKQLGWESYLIAFTANWSKENYWQKIVTYCQSVSKTTAEDKQLLFCLSVFFLHCLHEYNKSLVPEASPGQAQTHFSLVEAFTDINLPNPMPETKSKKRKLDNEFYPPHISIEKQEHKSIQSSFLMCVNCWDLLRSSESLQREFLKLIANLKLEIWLNSFLIDFALYKAKHEEALSLLQTITEPQMQLIKFTRIAGILYAKKKFNACYETILAAVPFLPKNNAGSLSNNLICGGNQRHLHYLSISYISVLQYLVKLLLRCVKDNSEKSLSEMSIGHLFVLVQLDWPQEEDLVPPLLKRIEETGSFHYPLFLNYIINVDILEEITHLWSSQGRQITLDIMPHMGQRRIGTRGADKGAKEEIKQAIKRQVARNKEKIDDLLISFITEESSSILQTLT